MTQHHPDLADEQAYIDHAYECLEQSRTAAWKLRDLSEADLGGTFQARFERNAFDEAAGQPPTQLDLGDAALCSAAIDRYAETPRRADSRASTSGASPWPTSTANRSSSTGGRPSPSRSTAPPAASRWASPAAATSPSRAARCSASRTSCSARATSASATTRGSPSRPASAAAGRRAPRLLHAARRARARPHRHARRHRRHDPGRAGRDHPLAAGRRARRAGRPGHRQDGRRAAPRRLPALHLPLPARGPGRARHRPEPGVPALHRAGAAVARRGRRRAGRARRPRARRRVRAVAATRPTRRWPRASRATPACATSSTRPSPTASGRCATTSSCRSAPGYLRLARRRDARASCATARRRFRRHNAARRGSRARCGRRWRRRGAATPVAAGDVRADGAHAARGPRGARADVAGAHAGRSCSTTCSARTALLRLAGRRQSSTSDEYLALHRPRATTSTTCAGPPPTSPCSTRPARCLGPQARQGRQGRRGRRDPHVRPHRHRRGAGPHADAAARWPPAAR